MKTTNTTNHPMTVRRMLDAAVILSGVLMTIGGYLGNEVTWIIAGV